jgi:hypothetical protein
VRSPAQLRLGRLCGVSATLRCKLATKRVVASLHQVFMMSSPVFIAMPSNIGGSSFHYNGLLILINSLTEPHPILSAAQQITSAHLGLPFPDNTSKSMSRGGRVINEALRGTREMHIGGGCQNPGGDRKPRKEDGGPY